jgi:GR25 family glycosyltransferase involved in LPS biosynthesis
MASELARLGLTIDGRKIGFHTASRFDCAYPFPTVGAKGCFHSHLAVLEEAKLNRFENVLILEDDCDFIGSIECALAYALNALKEKNWDFFLAATKSLFVMIAIRNQYNGFAPAAGYAARILWPFSERQLNSSCLSYMTKSSNLQWIPSDDHAASMPLIPTLEISIQISIILPHGPS